MAAFVLSDDLLGFFFGSDYLPAAFTIGPLVVATLFYAVYELLDTWLRGSGRLAASWRIAGSLLVGHVALNLVLIPRWELAGVVVTTVLSAVAAAVVAAVPAVRALGLRPRWKGFVRPVVAAAIAFAPLVIWDPGSGKESLAAAIPLAAVYVALLFLFRELGPEELRRARALFTRSPGAAAYAE
jgi:O-antigen/teichoic acid export membrane protein